MVLVLIPIQNDCDNLVDVQKSYFIIDMDYSITGAMMSLLLISIWIAPGHFLLVGVCELRCYQSQRPFTIGAAVAAVLEAEPAVGVGKLLGEQRGYAGCLMGRLLGKGTCSWQGLLLSWMLGMGL